MAKKSPGGGIALIGLILLGMLVQYWQVIIPAIILVIVVWLALKAFANEPKQDLQHRSFTTKSTPPPIIQPENSSVDITITTSYRAPSSRSAQERSVSSHSVWVPSRKTIECAGYSITGGLVYFGRHLKSIQRWGEEPSLIDPNLPVNKANPDRDGQKMGYWPSYSQIHPSSRAAYLEWLSEGRKDPKANIGYVFLYFYGLERRALADAKASASARTELPLIIAEVKRLLSIYGEHNSFRRYASSFLDALHVSQSTEPIYRTSPQLVNSSNGMSIALKIALGQLATEGIPLPTDWALAWAENDPSMPRRMPVMRCPEEFRELFRARYVEKFGDGLKLKPNKARIQAMYYPASSSFGGAVAIPLPDLPDLTQISGPSSKISDLVSACTDELEGYSRFLGRNPDGKNSVEASSYLPKVLLKAHSGKEFKDLSKWLSSTLSPNASLSISLTSLLQHLPSISKEKFGKKEATALANILAKIDVGMEPDPRFGIFLPKLDQDVVLFRSGENGPHTPSTEYSAATMVLHLASVVAGADGSVDETEERHLEEQLERWLHLSVDEITRLRAHTKWLLSSLPGMSGIKKRIELLKQSQRESLGRFLVGVAQADGYIDPKEMKILTKIYEVLELDTQSLYSHAHAAAVEPVTVQTEDLVRPQGFAIPKPSLQPSAGISLDMGSIETKLVETVAVSAILNEIFTEEEQAPPQESSPETTIDLLPIAGLDAETGSFMMILATKQTWAREELERLAAESNIMLDGTLDTINDVAFDHFGGPFFEGNDPIEINAEFAKEVAI